MYVAPLNYDRFFKKVFSDVNIAKGFLEAFLNVIIEEIEPLGKEHRITDEASVVEFDYRCKINGQYIIIDMQQWYKSDVVKRFYLYHSLSGALQLETLPFKSIKTGTQKKYETKNYAGLEPVVTLIWMVSDNLGFKEDYIAYALFPEQAADFIKNNALWAEENLKNIELERQKVLTLLNNITKGIDFLSQNKLIYLFQSNIVNNKKYSPYFDWFEFAEKTRNKENTKEDFEQYEKNESIMAAIQRLRKDTLVKDEFKYIEDWEQFEIESRLWKEEERKSLRKEVLQEGLKEGLKEGEAIGREKERQEFKKEVVITCYLQGLDISQISIIAKLSIEDGTKIIENYKKTLS
jgi:hypothetical protein